MKGSRPTDQKMRMILKKIKKDISLIINTSFLVAIRAELSKNIFIIVMKKQTKRQRRDKEQYDFIYSES
jgi:hypothetical protein